MSDSDREKDNNWGNKKSEYYERNKRTKDDDNYIEEEEQAIKIQQAKLKKLQDVNLLDSDQEEDEEVRESKGDNKPKTKFIANIADKYDLDSSDESDHQQKVKKTKGKKTKTATFKKLTKEEQEEQLQIIKNIKINISEIDENLHPILEILQNNIDSSLNLHQTKDYLQAKQNIHLLYATYMLYYLYFKNQSKISDHHPVIKKMFYLRSIMQQMKDPNDGVFTEIDKVLKLIEANKISQEEEEEELDQDIPESDSNSEENKLLNKKRAKDLIQENTQKIEKLRNEKEFKKIKEKKNLVKEIEYKNEMGQRLANANILKARGIYRKRKQYQGNAKLHLREKFHKKQMIRKNFVKEYEGKPEVYGGEATGIRRDLIRSTKIK